LSHPLYIGKSLGISEFDLRPFADHSFPALRAGKSLHRGLTTGARQAG